MAATAVAQARRMGLAQVVGVTATTNVASRRVLEKVGIRCDEVVEHAGLAHWLGRLTIAAPSSSRADDPVIG
jgi:hypothetical protein